jgi:hypothetical protein
MNDPVLPRDTHGKTAEVYHALPRP